MSGFRHTILRAEDAQRSLNAVHEWRTVQCSSQEPLPSAQQAGLPSRPRPRHAGTLKQGELSAKQQLHVLVLVLISQALPLRPEHLALLRHRVLLASGLLRTKQATGAGRRHRAAMQRAPGAVARRGGLCARCARAQAREKRGSSLRASMGWARLPLGAPRCAELHEGAQLRAGSAPATEQLLDQLLDLLGLRGRVKLVERVHEARVVVRRAPTCKPRPVNGRPARTHLPDGRG